MPYNANIPQPNDELSQSQDEMLNNFQSISALINVNHIDFNGATQGKHKWVSLPNQVLAPQALADELVLYTKEVNGNPQLFLRRQNDGAEIDFTSAVFGNPGWCRLPSGILLIWATINTGNTGNGNYTVNFPGAPFPVFQQVFSIQITPTWNGANTDPYTAYYAGPVTLGNPGSFVVRQQARALGSSNASTFNYLAIGI
jgi:hypothetical protein